MKKRGELLIVAITLVVLIMCIILFIVLVQYFQINTLLLGIKDSIFYICQNAILAYNEDNLAYEKYEVNLEKLEYIIEELLYENYLKSNGSVQKIIIKELSVMTRTEECMLHTNNDISEPLLHIALEVEFKPVVEINDNNIESFLIHDDIKLSLMKY